MWEHARYSAAMETVRLGLVVLVVVVHYKILKEQ